MLYLTLTVLTIPEIRGAKLEILYQRRLGLYMELTFFNSLMEPVFLENKQTHLSI